MKVFFFSFLLFALVLQEVAGNQKDSSANVSPPGKECSDFIRSFFASSSIPRSFSATLKARSEVRKKYMEVIASVEDFSIRKHKPFHSKAKVLTDPVEAFLAKVMMIRRAKETIDLSYYIFKSDDSGKTLLDELRKAVKRGVRVRIMVDSIGTLSNAPHYGDFKALLSLRGGKYRLNSGRFSDFRGSVEATVFNPVFNLNLYVRNWYRAVVNLFLTEGRKLPIIWSSPNRRSHDKILMIDSHHPENSMGIVGGRNIGAYYYALGNDSSRTFEDTEILLKGITTDSGELGEAMNPLESYYNKLFFYLANKSFSDFLFGIRMNEVKIRIKKMRDSAKLILRGNSRIKERLEIMEKEKFLENDFEEGLVSIVNELQNLTRKDALLDPLGKHNRKNGDSLVDSLVANMNEAKYSIKIVSPYLYMSDDELMLIKEWLRKDPRRTFQVISNSISTTDNIPAQAMVDSYLGKKLVTDLKNEAIATQIKVFAFGNLNDQLFGGRESFGKLHSKYVIIDDEITLVGSSNLDPRSRYLNSELGIIFDERSHSGRIAEKLNENFLGLVQRSHLWGSDEWREIRERKENRVSLALLKLAGKIISAMNLVPLL